MTSATAVDTLRLPAFPFSVRLLQPDALPAWTQRHGFTTDVLYVCVAARLDHDGRPGLELRLLGMEDFIPATRDTVQLYPIVGIN